ncbi:MAG: dynamin family protein [Campylobacteraceae bacterium]|jgi:predicted GTPase|nr:dynamin family protein [Campylobacteraceae bacterium]
MSNINKSLAPKDLAEFCSIVLSANEKNLSTFLQIDAFSKILENLFESKPVSVDLQSEKDEILKFFKEQNSQEFAQALFEAFDRLLEEEIVSAQKLEEIKTVFTLNPKVGDEQKSESFELSQSDKTFGEKLDILFDVLSILHGIFESDLAKKQLENVEKSLKNRSFSIGITGVMNAGKSTLLNALLRSNILGTAVVPETANLTLLKYSDTPKAKVNFWNEEEWEAIEKSAAHVSQISKFVKDTKEKFREKIGEFITKEGKHTDIDIKDISLYTSAEKSDMKCNLVQSVELYTDLEFLKDGVTIVDTPGLDDPVIKREEITKEYLNSCDLMIHLMNAAQSASEKDVEFIADAFAYQGISKLLVIITRIDAITKDELGEVISYTVSSIKKRLEKLNKNALFKPQNIDFIAVAGKLALMHRTGETKEALALGYSEEQTGIFEVENYLKEALFGSKSPKANLLIHSNAKTLYLVTEESVNAFVKESENLGKSFEELQSQLQTTETENARKEASIEKLLSYVKDLVSELREFGNATLMEIDARANGLRNKIFSRVYDDVRYELNKNKKKPSNERIAYIVESGLKDGMIDLVRDFRFGFHKKILSAEERLSEFFENVKTDVGVLKFDAKAFFENQANGVNLNFSVLVLKILTSLKKCSKSTLEEFGNETGLYLDDEFGIIKKEIGKILKILNANLIDDFILRNEEPLNRAKNVMQEEVDNLKKQIEMLTYDKQKAAAREKTIREKLIVLAQIQKRLSEIAI